MNSILQYTFLDNTIKAYLIVFGVILFTIIIKKLISKYCAGLLYKLVGKAGKSLTKQHFLDLVLQPLEMFILLFVVFVSIDKLNFPTTFDFRIFKVTSREIVDSITSGLLVILFIRLCVRLIDFSALIIEQKADLSKDANDSQLIVFFKDFFKVIIVIIGVLLLLHFSFHKNISNLLTGLSIVGAAIALATRESLENLIASFIIFFDKPFTTGDVVKVLQFTGTVEKIGLRSTRIRTENKTYITVPNKQMVDSVVDNISLRTKRKAELKLEIDIHTTAVELSAFTTAIKNMLGAKDIIDSFQVLLVDTGKQSHVIDIDVFADVSQSNDTFNILKEEVNFEIIKIAEQLAIKFATKDGK